MTHSTTGLAEVIRDLRTSRQPDTVLLGRLAGSAYHEVRYILRTEADGSHQIVGRASDWPMIQLKAEKAEVEALLAAATAQVEQADALAIDMRAKLTEAEQRAAQLRAELDQAQAVPPTIAAAATGLEPPATVPCPECARTFASNQALAAHRTRAHGWRKVPKQAAPPVSLPLAPIVLLPDNPAWRCANPTCTHAHARSILDPDYCQRCAKSAPHSSTNGHERAVGERSGL